MSIEAMIDEEMNLETKLKKKEEKEDGVVEERRTDEDH